MFVQHWQRWPRLIINSSLFGKLTHKMILEKSWWNFLVVVTMLPSSSPWLLPWSSSKCDHRPTIYLPLQRLVHILGVQWVNGLNLDRLVHCSQQEQDPLTSELQRWKANLKVN